MLICLFVRCEKGGVENIMDLPRDWEFELISDVQDLGDYLEVLRSWAIFLFFYLCFLYFYFIFLTPALLRGPLDLPAHS